MHVIHDIFVQFVITFIIYAITYAIIHVSARLIDFIIANLFNNGFQSVFLNFKNKVLADKKVIRIANQICIAL